MTDRLDVGLVPTECPGAEATGATHSSTLLIEALSSRHELTVYVSTQMDASTRTLPARDRVEYVLHDDLPKLPHPISTKLDALRTETDALNDHDLVHSASAAFIPVLADLDVPTVSTLNSYVPVCPKGDMLFEGKRKCSGPSPGKCIGCVVSTGLDRRQGLESELRAAYDSLGRLGYVETCMTRADDVTAYHAISPHLVEDYAALGFPADRIHVIPHFFEDRFHLPGGHDAVEAPVSLLYVGALQDIKGVDVLLRGLAELRARGVDATLRVAGRGPMERKLRSLALSLGVDDVVDWLGYVSHGELPAEFVDADVFVYPGRIDEPFGRVMLEALAAHTPVVAADVGSTDYILGEAGVRFESGDPDALADAAEQLLDDYGYHCAAVPSQLERFERERVLEQFDELYAAVAASRPVPASA